MAHAYYEHIRYVKRKERELGPIWVQYIPLRISIFMWRIFPGVLPTDANLKSLWSQSVYAAPRAIWRILIICC